MGGLGNSPRQRSLWRREQREMSCEALGSTLLGRIGLAEGAGGLAPPGASIPCRIETAASAAQPARQVTLAGQQRRAVGGRRRARRVDLC